MSFDEIKSELEKVDSCIMEYSINRVCKEELIKCYMNLNKLKVKFLNINFIVHDLNELEHIRFCMIENTIMLSIMICEQFGSNIKDKLNLLELLYIESKKEV